MDWQFLATMSIPIVSLQSRGSQSWFDSMITVACLMLVNFRFKNLEKHKSHFVRSAEDSRKAALWQATVHRLTHPASDSGSDMDEEVDE